MMSDSPNSDDWPTELVQVFEAIFDGLEANKELQEQYGNTHDNKSYTAPPKELTDLYNVGEKKAQKLRDAGYNEVEDLKGLSEDELNNVDGIGPAGATYIKKHLDPDDRWPVVHQNMGENL